MIVPNPAIYPFEDHYKIIGGHRIHYVDEGEGPRTLLFIHGNPTWSFEWRNIIPSLAKGSRCIAPDLLGFGRSDKPVDIRHTFEEHYEIIRKFIEALKLRSFVMVVHDWGGAFGFWYAMHNQSNVRGIATFEPVLLTMNWNDFSPERRKRFELLRDPHINFELSQVQNSFIETLPERVWRKDRMTHEVMDGYRAPFPTIESRKAVRRFPEMLPIGENSETYQTFKQMESLLPSLHIPVLLMTANPGALISQKKVAFLKEQIKDLDVAELGPGYHHLQEDYPQEIAEAISSWIALKEL